MIVNKLVIVLVGWPLHADSQVHLLRLHLKSACQCDTVTQFLSYSLFFYHLVYTCTTFHFHSSIFNSLIILPHECATRAWYMMYCHARHLCLSEMLQSNGCEKLSWSELIYLYFPPSSHLIYQGWPTSGSQATCSSLKGYLWLLINVHEFPFHFFYYII